MTVAFVQEIAAAKTTSLVTTTGAVTVSGATANNLLFASLSIKSSLGGAVADDTGNWTVLDEHDVLGASGATFYRIASGTSADDFDASWPSAREYALTICEYSGAATSSPLNTSSEYTTYSTTDVSAGTPIGPVTATPGSQPGLAITTVSQRDAREGDATELTVDNSFTNAQLHGNTGNDPVAGQASKRYTSTSAINASWDTSLGVAWRGYLTLALFDEASAGGSITGTLAKTEAADTSAASGTQSANLTGTSSNAEAADTSAASGSVTGNRTGTVAVSESADTSAGSGTTNTGKSGTAAIAEVIDFATATGVVNKTITGTIAVTEGADFVPSEGGLGFLPSLTGDETEEELRRKRNQRLRYIA